MRVTAIISEYNPLHNGHIKHIETARRDTGADYIIAVMSGNYVQRGAPAFFSKYERAKEALMAGADLVLEIPAYYSCSSLEYFARGAVSLIAGTGVVNCISFGSECGETALLTEAADTVLSQNSGNDKAVRDRLAQGLSFSQAINSSSDIKDHIKDILSTPNNLLAAAYIAAAGALSFDCEFHTMKRIGNAYNDETAGALSSASIRRDILDHFDHAHPQDDTVWDTSILKDIIKERMPENILASAAGYLDAFRPMSEESLSLLLFSRIQDVIRTASCQNTDPALKLTEYLDVSISLANKIINRYTHAPSYTALCSSLKSKDINYSRISRALLHILLDIRKDRMDEYVNDGYNYYIKPLGFRRDSSGLLHEIKIRASIPLITKAADHSDILRTFYLPDSPGICSHALRMFYEDTAASELYEKTVCSLSRQQFTSEYEHTVLII